MTENAVPGQVQPTSPAATTSAAPASRFGLTTAIALIMGSIIGVGVFNLPTSLAPYGPITLVSMGLTTVGALALAVLFSALARRLPADGGPYAYARVAFGNGVGFINAWSYWITAWAGNAAIAVGWVLYVEHFVNKDGNKLFSILLVLVGLWVPAAINLSGVKNMGAIQVVTTILKFAALAFMSTVGLFFINTARYLPWNVSGQSPILAVGSGMAIALFSYLGVETASVAAGKVRDPDRNVPRATILGTLATALVYILSLVAIFGILPNQDLASVSAPYSAAVDSMFGGTAWGNVMAILVIISGLGALNGWTMICAEMPLAAARDGLFPERFNRLSKAGVPAFGIVASTVLASVAMIVNFLGDSGPRAFTTLVLMTGITAAIPYAFSALAQIRWRWNDRRALVSAENPWTYWAPFILAGVALVLGIPVYNAQRRHMTRPQAVPAYR
ncbi:MAG: amino acid permease [Chloroflexi bacterium]|nr:MAG: amino acid permease [Chloroflexota bacterium]